MFTALPKRLERRCLGNRYCDLQRRLRRITREVTVSEAKRSLSPNGVISCAPLRRPHWPESIADVGIVAAEKLMLLRHEWSQREAARHRRQPEIGERPGQRESISRADCDVCDNPKATKGVVTTFLAFYS